MSLDAAIELWMKKNLDGLAARMAIPEAKAAILTANLRGRPLMYADGQLIPYGSFSSRRSDGVSQYDVNITTHST